MQDKWIFAKQSIKDIILTIQTMTIIQTMKELLHDIESKTICYNALAEQMKMKKMTFNTIAETRFDNHHDNID